VIYYYLLTFYGNYHILFDVIQSADEAAEQHI